ncbi:hypothetical protein FBD94_01385 [Pedobacter hiemivivus]|uniref:DUF5000 domain-containing protein n=1 Tax=Pedobacter hiemivivus TaxID=2530454 RepID=A0A4R0NID3_9SPHI|nr:DUF4998 domain-containing protein [Pedobacter hiemivivus]TCC98584.1 hypothetical protein EZ444_04725 [Pedobacter hiemivivus]TKC65232.1 hypothetical protein FBD94_01385 [Pedobacter hiemivivus]
MKNLIIFIGLFLLVIAAGCEKQQTDFRDFLDGHEVTYTGSAGEVLSRAGNLRTQLKWKSSADPSIIKYVIYWNNKVDSQVVAINGKTDSVFVTIPNLQEFVYSFTIYSYDAKGNKSVPKVVNGVKIYGPIYKAGLLNRAYNADVPYVTMENGNVELNFNKPDTVNVTTKVKYTNTANIIKEVDLAPADNILKLTDYKPGTEVTYRSSYKPTSGALDVFTTSDYSVFPQMLLFPCDKSLFREHPLPNDVGTYESGTSVSKLWDRSVGPQGYPNIFHSNGSGGMPHTLTFDLGKVYPNLAQVEETGRDCCNNPDSFEIWGIADITNAATTLPANNGGWKDESIAKGWTLLKEVTRTDDGKNAYKTNLVSNPPPVRYIRIRIKHVTTNDGNYSNMSEITFWNKQVYN